MSGLQSQQLLDISKLAVVVPDNTRTADIVSLLHSSNAQIGQDNSLSGLEQLSQRKALFLDEVIDILVILQARGITGDALERLTRELVVSIEAFAVGTRRLGAPNEPDDKVTTFKDLVYSWSSADESDQPKPECFALSNDHDDGDDRSDASIYVCWTATVHLARGRIRSSNPSLYFSASASLSPDDEPSRGQERDEYLPSGVPASLNLLDAFQNDPAFKGNPPVLPASRLAKILPTGVEGQDQPRTLRINSRPLLQLVPAIRSRTRCSRIGASPNHAKVLACLDIDVSPFIDGHVELDQPRLTLSDGVVESLGSPQNLSFPLSCKPHDSLSFIYNLASTRRLAATSDDKLLYSLNIVVNATFIRQDQVSIPLRSSYRISVDLSVLHSKPYFLQSQKRLPPLTSQSQRHSTPAQPDHLAHLITVTISSPPKAPVGSTLTWSILLANRSSTRTLDLAIIPITHPHSSPSPSTGPLPGSAHPTPTKPRHSHKPTLSTSLFTASGHPTTATSAARSTTPPPSSSAARRPTLTGPDQGPGPAGPVPAAAANPDDIPTLVSLTPDIRTGALQPGASMQTTMQFLVLRAGVVGVHAVRVVDLGESSAGAGPGAQAERKEARPFVDLTGVLLPDVVAFEAVSQDEGGSESEDEAEGAEDS